MAVDFSIMSKNNKFLESNVAAAIARDAILVTIISSSSMLLLLIVLSGWMLANSLYQRGSSQRGRKS